MTARKRGPEAQLLAAVLDALRMMRGIHVLRMNAGAVIVGAGKTRRHVALGEIGTPDLLVMLPAARTVWLELKSPKGTCTPAQLAWHERARKLGHTVYVVRDTRAAVELVATERNYA